MATSASLFYAALATLFTGSAGVIPARLLPETESMPMFDLMMVVIALGFFVLALGYVVACERM